ncbi:MAG: ATP-dependent helicase/nuclease subunit A [Verrucomicrobiales bacterium]|jgi:ATP-dependent helicase/nuclease subunit A
MNILAKNLMILASAGSGKTYQLGNRVIGKIGLEGVSPERIVALTFTRKAAGEFADSVLTKLAEGTRDPEKAAQISKDLNGEIDVSAVLGKVVKALPKLQLTTLDGFFSRIVRGFQYELGISGGTFDLLQGERQKTAEAEIINGVLRDGFANRKEFYHAFRRATLGRGEQGVRKSLEEFVKDWHSIWKSGVHLEMFGCAANFGDLPQVGDWATQKDSLIHGLRSDENPTAVEKLLDTLAEHSVGRSLTLNTIGERLMEILDQTGPVKVKNGRNNLEIPAPVWMKWQDLLNLAVRCELAAAVARTQAVGELIAEIDREHARQLRSRGLLSFDDVKVLLSEGMRSEEGRLRRELVDYRLDGRYDHWLLDEFQDTSPAEWRGLESLVNEAVSDPEGGLFVVGDRKQAIYAWRGGDVSLFDDLIAQYQGGMEVESMAESYRSCPAVLDLVNAVCRDGPTLESLFGKALRQCWVWEDHVSAAPDVNGESRVTVVPKGGSGKAMVEQLRLLGIGEKKLSCGVLVRSGKQVEEYADLLRSEGFDVIEEGKRKPCSDHAIGVALSHFVRWLADPADSFSKEVVAMCPLNAELERRYEGGWFSRWEGSMKRIQDIGYAGFLGELIDPEWEAFSEYGRRRASDIMAALAEFDASGQASPRAARDWISDLEISQTPGAAAVQVMTIHKSKGLGFDVVILPSMSDSQIPDDSYFKVARGQDWLLQVPAKWARKQISVLREAHERWAQDQRYEAMCVLYVALTRSKRGLYVFLEEEPKSRKDKELWRSPANLIRISAGEDFQSGNPNWTDPMMSRCEEVRAPVPVLGKRIPLRQRASFSGVKGSSNGSGGVGRRIGAEVHELIEKIAWLKKGEVPNQPFSQSGKIVEEALKLPHIHRLFEDRGAELFREQRIELIVDGRWMSGVIDRLHVHRDGESVVQIEVIDFKSDADADAEVLLARYGDQMRSYRRAVATIFEIEESVVTCLLLSTHLSEVIEVGDDLEPELKQGEPGP